MKMILLFNFLFILGLPSGFCETTSLPQKSTSKSGGVIDVGSLEVEGELRRPSLNWIDAKNNLNSELKRAHEAQLSSLEKKLTEPVSADEMKIFKSSQGGNLLQKNQVNQEEGNH